MSTSDIGDIIKPDNVPLYNGLITFGTPHHGVYGADLLINKPYVAINIPANACESLTAGPAIEEVSGHPIGRLLNNLGFFQKGLELACENGSKYGLPAAINFFSTDVEPELTTTNAPNIPEMPTDHKAVFYGVEEGHDDGTLAPRFIGAVKNSPNDFAVYGADITDDLGIAYVGSKLDHYTAMWQYWDSQIEHGGFWDFLYQSDDKKDAWGLGMDWFTRLDPAWQRLTGSMNSEIVVGCRCEEENYVYYYGEDLDCSDPNSFGGDGECTYEYSIDITQKLSDGFILEESTNSGPGMNYDPVRMDGSNHLQMKNDSNMKAAIEAIFINGLGGTYFQTDPR